MGWANASVRAVDELPKLEDVSKAKGIVMADDPEQAFWHTHQPYCGANGSERQTAPLLSSMAERSYLEGDSVESKEDEKKVPSEAALQVLKNLQELPWCRIDCSFKGTLFPFFAHNLIQVTREWINWEGEELTKAIADHFFDLEKILRERTEDEVV